MRFALFVVATLASWVAIMAWAARIDVGSPPTSDLHHEFPGQRFRAVFGSGVVTGTGLRVASPGEDFTALQSLQAGGLDAAKTPILRYRFAGLPRTLEVAFVFRGSEHPDDVTTISLPWPGDGATTFDLRRVHDWRGRILEIGFAEFPTPQVVPPERGFRPFELAGASLRSPSWQSGFAGLASDWFGDWPWTQRSVHALGRDSDTPGSASMVVCVALATGAAFAWGWLILRWRRRATLVALVAVVVAGWLVLDLRWQANLAGRLRTARAVYAPLDWSARERAVGDSEIAGDAERLRRMIASEPVATRVLVYGDGAYPLLRFLWHLLPRNVGLYVDATAAAHARLPDGCLIVFYRDDSWRTSASWRDVLAHSTRYVPRGSVFRDGFDESRIVVFRYRRNA
jgi:hypothetical protein